MRQPATPSLMVVRIIPVALMMGLLVSTGVIVALKLSGSMPAGGAAGGLDPQMLMMILGAVAIGSTMGILLLPAMMMSAAALRYAASPSEEGRQGVLMQTLQVKTVLRAALAEGVGLLGAVFYMISGEWPMLIAPAVAAVAILLFIPTKGSIQRLRERLERTHVP